MFNSLCLNVSMLLALKLYQLIWAAARGRRNDEMIRLWVHTRYSQFPGLGSFTCLSIEHWVQGTLWLYATCNWQACWDFANENHLKIFRFPTLGLNPGPPVQQANYLSYLIPFNPFPILKYLISYFSFPSHLSYTYFYIISL